MTELYQARSATSETTEPAGGPEQETDEHDDLTRDESAPDGNHGHERGHAEMQATLADEDQLPTRQDARAATWSEDPEYYDESDPDPQYDADLDALTADEDHLPTRQDARAATWGEDPNTTERTTRAHPTTQTPATTTHWTVTRVTKTKLPPTSSRLLPQHQMSSLPKLPTAGTHPLPRRPQQVPASGSPSWKPTTPSSARPSPTCRRGWNG
jgi:hypothetical protein